MNLTVENTDIEGCHRIDKGNPETTIVRFVNRKFCNLILDKKHELKKIGNAKLCFQNNVTLFVSENLYPLNQSLAWKYREPRRASKIHTTFSSKGIMKICSTMTDRPISFEHRLDIFYSDFVFKEKKLMRRAVVEEVLSSKGNVFKSKVLQIVFVTVYQYCSMP